MHSSSINRKNSKEREKRDFIANKMTLYVTILVISTLVVFLTGIFSSFIGVFFATTSLKSDEDNIVRFSVQSGVITAATAGILLMYGIIKFRIFTEYWIRKNVNGEYQYNMARKVFLVALGVFLGIKIFLAML